MNRRCAIQKIILTSGAIATLTHCGSSDAKFPNLLIDRDENILINEISKCILSVNEKDFYTIDSRINFILTMINDCYRESDISKYLLGLEQFKLLINQKTNLSFEKLPAEEKIKHIEFSIDSDKEVGFFINTIKQLSLRHFMTSENYMKTYLKFEFMPNRYLGRVKL